MNLFEKWLIIGTTNNIDTFLLICETNGKHLEWFERVLS